MVYAFGMYKESGSRGDGANNMLCKWQDAQNSYELHVRRADAVLIKRRGDQLCIAPQQEPCPEEPPDRLASNCVLQDPKRKNPIVT